MNDARTELRPWPPAFSDDFVDGALRMFRETNHLMIAGCLGSSRGALAAAVTGGLALTVWGRDEQGRPDRSGRYGTINQLVPDLVAEPTAPADEVAEQVTQALTRGFGSPVVALREADRCDEGSLEVLARLVDQQAIRLVSTVDPDATLPTSFARTAARLDLPPLEHGTIVELLTARFRARPHPTAVTMLATWSHGAYAVLKELADAAFRIGYLTVIAGQLVTDTNVPAEEVGRAAHEATANRRSSRFSFDHPARDLIEIAALTETLDLAEARAVFGPEAVQVALDLGAVRVRAAELTFRSDIEATILQRELTQERRTELHDQYADRLPESFALRSSAPRLAQWTIGTGRPLPIDLAIRASARANRENRYGLALTFVEAIEPDDRPEALLIEQCHALSERGAAEEVRTLLRACDARSLDADDLFVYLRWADRLLPRTEMQDLVAAIRGGTDPADDARHAVVTLSALSAESFQNGAEVSRRGLRTLAESGQLSDVGQAMARAAIALSLRQASRVDEAVRVATEAAAALRASEDAATCNVEAAQETLILCLLSAGDLEAARRALEEYSAPGLRFGNLGRLGTALWGLHAFYTEDTSTALAHAQLCLARTPDSDPHHLRSWMEALAALVLSQVGDGEHARGLLHASQRHDPNPRRQFDLQRRISQACVHDAIGELDEALSLLQGVVEEARRHEMTLLEVDAAVLSVLIGGPMHLRQLLRAVETIDEGGGTSWIWKRFAEDVRDNDMRSLVRLAEELDASGRALFAAEVAQFTLDIARRAADMSPQQRQHLTEIADSMRHRHVTRST